MMNEKNTERDTATSVNIVICLLFAVLAGMLFLRFSGCFRGETEHGAAENAESPRIRLYAGAGLRRAVDELCAAFTAESGIGVEVDYGGSGMIIIRAREDSNADLFMPGDVWYVDRLHEKSGLIAEKVPVSYFVPVIIVRKGNPKKIKGLEDFFRSNLRVGLGRADACQIGRISAGIFAKNGFRRSEISKPKESLTVNELGVWVKMDDIDAAIVWDAIAANIADEVEAIPIPAEQNIISRVVIGRMKTSPHPEAATAFINFITGSRGQEILRSRGYRIEAP